MMVMNVFLGRRLRRTSFQFSAMDMYHVCTLVDFAGFHLRIQSLCPADGGLVNTNLGFFKDSISNGLLCLCGTSSFCLGVGIELV